MEPIGVHSFWGFSPAVDLQQLYRTAFGSASWDSSTSTSGAAAPLAILLVQPSDPRSVIKTIAQRFRHSARPLHVRAHALSPTHDTPPCSPSSGQPPLSPSLPAHSLAPCLPPLPPIP